MRKTLTFLFLLLVITIQVNGQGLLKSVSLDYIASKANNWELKPTDYEGAIITDQVYSSHNGVTHVYVTQAYKGIPIYNAISTINIKNDQVFYAANNFISDIESKVVDGRAATITEEEAVMQAAQQLQLPTPKLTVKKTNGATVVFDGSTISNSDIPVKPMYVLTPEGQLALTYDLSIDMKESADYWSIRVDAHTGKILDQDNWTVYCNHTENTNHSHAGGVCHENKSASSTAFHAPMAAGGTYTVYALPAESPIHGPLVTVNNPADLSASPFGWHDVDGIEGAEYTITRGNNVHAYADPDQQNSSSGGEPDGGADLIFDFPHDLNQEPEASLDAAQVNLFYVNNMMHDITFKFGFDEVGGNFQERNYTNQGQPTDAVAAEAIDGSGTNNANFSTPPDGGTGRMQMFLWDNPSGVFSIESPLEIAGVLPEVGLASDFGAIINNTTDIAGSISLAEDVSPSSSTQNCLSTLNTDQVAGTIALVDRGLCDFSVKAYNVQQAGAIGCIIVNVPGVNGGTGEEIIGMTGGDRANEVTIPVLFLKKSDGDKIKQQIANGNEVFARFKEVQAQGASQLDASFDNGVIAHEYAHGISNRLTGGPSAAGCLQNGEQMGEGWSDFFSLITSAEEGDQGADARGIGTFVNAQTPAGGGIRQFPYSTDMSINPLTFDDVITTNGVHALGTIWCTMVWDLYWAMAEKHGYDPFLTDPASGSYKAVQLVMDGMKMQACNPGFIQGRDAILMADEANYGGENALLIWETFARRGLGYSANGGSTDSTVDGIEAYDLPPLLVEELKIERSAPELITPGSEFEVTVDIVNHIPSIQEEVIVTDLLQEGLTYVAGSGSIEPVVNGNTLTFEVGTMAYQEEIEITYMVKSSADIRSLSTYLDDFEDNNGWEEADLEDSGFTWFEDNVGRDGSTGWGVDEVSVETDQVLISPSIAVVGEKPALRFWHQYDTNRGNNGGFVQISTNDGNTYKTVREDDFLRNGYPTTMAYGLFAIPSLEGFSGSTNEAFVDSYIDLSEYKGQDIRVRFRFGSQEGGTVADVTFPGWYIDDFEVMDLKTYASTACIGTVGDPEQNCAMNTTVIDAATPVSNTEVLNDYFNVRVFPNPANDFLSIGITSPDAQDVQVRLIGVDGRTVHTLYRSVDNTETVATIPTATYASGLYIVEVRTNEKVTTTKAMIK